VEIGKVRNPQLAGAQSTYRCVDVEVAMLLCHPTDSNRERLVNIIGAQQLVLVHVRSTLVAAPDEGPKHEQEACHHFPSVLWRHGLQPLRMVPPTCMRTGHIEVVRGECDTLRRGNLTTHRLRNVGPSNEEKACVDKPLCHTTTTTETSAGTREAAVLMGACASRCLPQKWSRKRSMVARKQVEQW
jgi:hypothetical protein